MSLQDMPAPGTAQWQQWFQMQSPDVQQTVLWSMGYNQANQLPAAAQAGGMSPQLDPTSYDLSSGMQAPVAYNSKGKVLPFGLDQAAKTTNVIQDRNSLLPDNVIAMLSGTGSYGPDAFQPTYTPTGQPLQDTGQRTLQAYSQSGGWQGFVASQILKGASPSAAIAALKAFVMSPPTDSASPEAQQARTELINSLPTRYQQPDSVTGAMPKVDYSTPAGFANSFDEKALSDQATGMFEKVMSDPVAGYTDPKTGLSYVGATEAKTPEMEYYDKAGLPYPTSSYNDSPYAQPLDQDAVKAWMDSQNSALAAQDQAKTAATKAQADLDRSKQTYMNNPRNQLGPNDVVDGSGTIHFGVPNATALPAAVRGTAGSSAPAGYNFGQDANTPVWHETNLQTGAPAGMYPGRGSNAADAMSAAQQRLLAAQNALGQATAGVHATEDTPDNIMQTLLQQARMRKLADSGRTPLQDALTQRMLTIRNQGVLGY